MRKTSNNPSESQCPEKDFDIIILPQSQKNPYYQRDNANKKSSIESYSIEARTSRIVSMKVKGIENGDGVLHYRNIKGLEIPESLIKVTNGRASCTITNPSTEDKTINFIQSINKISKYYEHKMPVKIDFENMFNIERIMNVDCTIDKKQITYFIELPLTDETEFDLYKLMSIPTKAENDYVTVLPRVKYLLEPKIEHLEILGLETDCESVIGDKFLCSSTELSNSNLSCETSILRHSSTENCKYTVLVVNENLMKWIPELNQYLATFPNQETLKIQNLKETKNIILKGVFLINSKDNNVTFRNSLLQNQFIQKLRRTPKVFEVG
ncbi:hypothetical protein LSTR_LSTR011091 [Laodelphax striatellus]|uniref:Uncharacterized protein n=1 Tax=Laodelphax striatellus TaxID=195883 RepID=A0A482WVN1_LAOST|nr:hypothetical protein LSTR_LSTR011091 [Laodelphax striatellus]